MNIRFAFAKVDLLIVMGFRCDLGDYTVLLVRSSFNRTGFHGHRANRFECQWMEVGKK